MRCRRRTGGSGVIAQSEWSFLYKESAGRFWTGRGVELNGSTTIRLASLDEVMAAKAYICFVSRPKSDKRGN